jgi:hypothetical protein
MDMNEIKEISGGAKPSFLSHVFSTNEEDKAEVLNTIQYALYGIIPVVILNKLIQRFIPEADPEKSSIELLAEILIQLVVIFSGLVIIHRTITYFPTYSGFKYEHLAITNVILGFLVIIFSIQSKVGIKINILFERISELWNGPSEETQKNARNKLRVRQGSSHSPSQADFLDSSKIQSGVFPPAPTAVSREGYDNISRSSDISPHGFNPGPMAANSVLGGSFGSSF